MSCPVCGGLVALVSRPGRVVEHRCLTVEIPADLEIETCTRCGEMWVNMDKAVELDAALDARLEDD